MLVSFVAAGLRVIDRDWLTAKGNVGCDEGIPRLVSLV